MPENIIRRIMEVSSKPIIWIGLAAMFICLTSAPYAASVMGQGISRGYATKDPGLRPGMAVVLSDSGAAEKQLVERAGREDTGRIIGIATTTEESLVTVTSSEDQVYVKGSGVVAAFVSDVNGDVKQGDRLTISPLKGILMLSQGGEGSIGVASESLANADTETQTINTGNGEKSVAVGKIAVSLDSNLGYESKTGNEGQPSSLQRLGKSVIGRDVGELQVVVALVIFFMMMIAEGGIIYGAVSSSITSLGRNPMAKTIIIRELARVVGVVVIVLLVGLAAIYAVLLI